MGLDARAPSPAPGTLQTCDTVLVRRPGYQSPALDALLAALQGTEQPTAAYGLGQIIGPPMVAWTLHRAATPSQGFTQGLVAAAAALVLGAALYAVMVWRWPLRAR
jgi:hypothetical protein